MVEDLLFYFHFLVLLLIIFFWHFHLILFGCLLVELLQELLVQASPASAYIADISTNEDRAKNFGLIGRPLALVL
jgi:hypothetical protein